MTNYEHASGIVAYEDKGNFEGDEVIAIINEVDLYKREKNPKIKISCDGSTFEIEKDQLSRLCRWVLSLDEELDAHPHPTSSKDAFAPLQEASLKAGPCGIAYPSI